ncbi:hypothetical protein [Demequina sp. NBRC 110053]|uniref:hypothetical protein n=1 Tax=Demequina sp. NBRC 110053 TaxID=1570342 RepID=UPI000A0203D3|nr:hypothetical protein [Demequina sp. NBRC 110053]
MAVLCAAVAAIAALVASSVTHASAATLNVSGSGIVTMTNQACTTASLAATAPAASAAQTTVRLTGVPAACIGTSIDVALRASNGARLSSGTLTPAAQGQNAVPMSSYDTSAVATVAVLLNGWWVPASWTAPAPPAAYSCVSVNASLQPTGAPCTVNPTGPFDSYGSPGSRQGHGTFTVTTTSANAIVSLNLNAAPLPSWAKGAVGTNGDWIKVPGYSCSELPVLRLYANPSNGGKGTPVYVSFAESASAAVGGRICPAP